MPEEQPHVRITLQTIYDKQLDNERLLVRTLERLDGLADVPVSYTHLTLPTILRV